MSMEDKLEHLKKEVRMLRDASIELYVDLDNSKWKAEQLTIAQAKEIASFFNVATNTQPLNQSKTGLEGQRVIVRASAAGVHYGTLESVDGTTVKLTNARRLWYWQVNDKKGISLSDVAEHGVSKSSKICAVVPVHIIIDAAEIMTTSEKAQKTIEEANVYTA